MWFLNRNYHGKKMKKLSYKHGNKHTSSVSQGITNMWTASGMQCVNDPETMAGAWTWPAHASDTIYTHSWGPPSAPAEIPGSWLNKCVNTFCSESQRVYEYLSVIFSVFAFFVKPYIYGMYAHQNFIGAPTIACTFFLRCKWIFLTITVHTIFFSRENPGE